MLLEHLLFLLFTLDVPLVLWFTAYVWIQSSSWFMLHPKFMNTALLDQGFSFYLYFPYLRWIKLAWASFVLSCFCEYGDHVAQKKWVFHFPGQCSFCDFGKGRAEGRAPAESLRRVSAGATADEVDKCCKWAIMILKALPLCKIKSLLEASSLDFYRRLR